MKLTESHAVLMSLPSGAGMFNLPAEMLSFTPAAQVVPPACRLPGEQGQAAAAPFLHLCQSALVALLHTSCSECSARLQAFGRTMPELLLLPPVWDAACLDKAQQASLRHAGCLRLSGWAAAVLRLRPGLGALVTPAVCSERLACQQALGCLRTLLLLRCARVLACGRWVPGIILLRTYIPTLQYIQA